jgi:hypothetical protein
MGSANPYSHYDETVLTDCRVLSNHLKFTKTGKGVYVPGPIGWTDVPDFTLSFWVFITNLNADTCLINLFDRAYVTTASADYKIYFKFDRNGSTIEPTYGANTVTVN